MSTIAGVALLSAFAITIPGCVAIDIFDIHDDDVASTRFEASASFSYTVPVAARVRLRLEGVSGRITVMGSPAATEITIAGERTAGSESQSDADRHLDDVMVRLSTTGSEVRVWTNQPANTHGRRYEVDYRVTLPSGFGVIVSNTNGEIEIDGMTGSVGVDNVNGQVTLADLSCDVRADVVNGRITAGITVPSGATIDLGTVNGIIQLDLPRDASAELNAQVVNGVISVIDLPLDEPVVRPGSLRGTLGSGDGTIELSTVNGSISIRGVD